MTYALGIDLGTTFTAAAISREGRTEVFQLGERAAAIPTVVLLREDGEIIVGDPAARRAVTHQGRSAREFKRRLGDPVPLLLGGTPYSPEVLSAQVIRAVIAEVTAREGEEPAVVAVTHPAAYSAYRMELFTGACRQAGITDPVLCPEPVAAAVFYASRERVGVGEKVAVYDLGGGTFDAAVVEKTEDGFRIIGQPDGIDRLGGVDFDQAIFGHVARALELNIETVSATEAGITALARLREECREAKEALSSDTEATIPVLLPGVQTQVRLTRSEFEAMVRPRIEETIAALRRTARSAGLELEQVDRVLLVGGSSRIPLVGQMVSAAAGKPVVVDAHPKHAIALGAALAALASERVGTGRITGSAASSEPQEELAAASSSTGVTPAASVSTPPEPVSPSSRPARKGPSVTVFAVAGGGLVGLVIAAFAVFALLGGGGNEDGLGGLAPTAAPGGTAASPTQAAAGAPAGPTQAAAATASIDAITVVNGRYSVTFSTRNLALNGVEGVVHVHFFFDTVSQANAGVPGSGPWFVYGGPSPFTGYAVSERPAGAQQMCILVANPDHSVRAGTGNCRPLP
jgi:actin-like ATPase involved in cell morphogenesis